MAARLGRVMATVVEVGKAVLSRSSLPALRLLVYSADLPALKKCASERVSTCHPHSDSHSPIINSKRSEKHFYALRFVPQEQVALSLCSSFCSMIVAMFVMTRP